MSVKLPVAPPEHDKTNQDAERRILADKINDLLRRVLKMES